MTDMPETGDTEVDKTMSLKFVLDVDGLFKLVAVGMTGESFKEYWDVVGDMESPDDEYNPTFHLRNLYLQKEGNGYVVQLGALPVENHLFRTGGFAFSGWIDGARLRVHAGGGNIAITAGSLTDPEHPGIYDRDFKFNYLEVKMSKRFFEKLCVEAAVERLEDVNYAKAAVKYDAAIAADRILTFIGEAIVSDEGDYRALLGVQADIVELCTGEKSGFKVIVNYHYGSQDFNSYRKSLAYWSAKGHSWMISTEFPLKEEWGLSGYANYEISDDSSYICIGVVKSLNFKKYYQTVREKLIKRD
jgi:hypothetical protein